MGNSFTPYSMAIGHDYICFLTPHFKFFRTESFDNDEILKTSERSLDPIDLHVSRCGKNSFKKLNISKIHANYKYFIF